MLADLIAAKIREVDGNHTMGAGALGEAIADMFRQEDAVYDYVDGGGPYLVIGWPHGLHQDSTAVYLLVES